MSGTNKRINKKNYIYLYPSLNEAMIDVIVESTKDEKLAYERFEETKRYIANLLEGNLSDEWRTHWIEQWFIATTNDVKILNLDYNTRRALKKQWKSKTQKI